MSNEEEGEMVSFEAMLEEMNKLREMTQDLLDEINLMELNNNGL